MKKSCFFLGPPTYIQDVSGGIVNILGGGSMDLLTYSMVQSPS